MDGDRERTLNRRTLTLAAVAFVVTFALVVGVGAVGARRATAPKIILLGSGKHLSVLVTAGPARLLIASGTDTTAFGNALGAALPLGLRRIDVALLAGHGRGSAVAAHVARSVPARTFAAIDPGLSMENPGTIEDRRIEFIADPRRYRLPRDVVVTVEHLPLERERNTQSGWRITVEHGRTRVVILSDGKLAGAFPPGGPVSALVITGANAKDAVTRAETASLIVCAENVSGEELREDISAAVDGELLALRVFSGQATTLAFVPDGLRLPNDVTTIGSEDSSRVETGG